MALTDYFRRILFNTRERPTSADWNRLQNRIYESLRVAQSMAHYEPWESSGALAPASRFYGFGPQGFHDAGFLVTTDAGNPPFGLSVLPGRGLARTGPASATDIDGCTGADWYQSGSLAAPLNLSAATGFTVPAPPAVGSARIDTIEVRPQYTANDSSTVGVFNVGTGVFDALAKNKTLTWDLLGLTGTVNDPNPSTAAISYKVGQTVVGAISAATEPATTAGYVKIGRINVLGGAASITTNNICDMRPLLFPQGKLQIEGRIGIPGIAAGLGTGGVRTLELPPGVLLKAYYANGVAPAAGSSYLVLCILLGGDLRPRTSAATRGVAVANGQAANRIASTGFHVTGQLSAGQVSILNGTDANYNLLNTAYTFAEGQPYAAFAIFVADPTGGALGNTEESNFHYSMSMG